ncbi:MAG: Asp-tRNA(Asn)/Glu-tRNA(Gln) amidotransferase subunit GatC [Gammaproteobacteria bacterium]|nr:Asp-tRNA(Asn)/Glu-tRNA(Gln) amidotransferase subunit GatC [Gammaproteobacteria bacterium]MCY4322541.1 Asp-tRNA(Asn)/Glu-tRNA(Gln) amidotransferase subunit GatC [Gammaproteobacteria bacterium]
MTEKSLDITYLSRLAALRFDADETIRAQADIARIIDMIEAMQAVKTEGVEPLAHPHEAVQRLRDDQVTEDPDPGTLQTGAPAAQDGFYLVPRFVE